MCGIWIVDALCAVERRVLDNDTLRVLTSSEFEALLGEDSLPQVWGRFGRLHYGISSEAFYNWASYRFASFDHQRGSWHLDPRNKTGLVTHSLDLAVLCWLTESDAEATYP